MSNSYNNGLIPTGIRGRQKPGDTRLQFSMSPVKLISSDGMTFALNQGSTGPYKSLSVPSSYTSKWIPEVDYGTERDETHGIGHRSL